MGVNVVRNPYFVNTFFQRATFGQASRISAASAAWPSAARAMSAPRSAMLPPRSASSWSTVVQVEAYFDRIEGIDLFEGGGDVALIDLAGKRFGRLVVIRRVENKSTRHAKWLCLCDCGMETQSLGQSLRSGESSSCGCLRSEQIVARQKTHGLRSSREYRAWGNMIQRVMNPKNGNFHHYGGRGIKVCENWRSFQCFYSDIGECPPGHTIERVDNDGDYEKSNCVWAPRTAQARNTRRTSIEDVGITETEFGTFEVRIRADGKRIHVGTYASLADAKSARKQAERLHWGVE